MQKIDSVFHQNTPLGTLAKQAQSQQRLQQFWVAACPALLSQYSSAASLKNGQLTIYAHSAMVASKIKLTSAQLLTQLQHLQQSDANFGECKVTAIIVKVQVKSQPEPTVKPMRKLSKNAANTLKEFASNLGESPLAQRLHSLANKVSQ